jgi:hypothetical protein
VRTKSAAQLPTITQSAALERGLYSFQLILSQKNKKAVLKEAFGDYYDQYKESLAHQASLLQSTFPIYRLKHRNILALPEMFGTTPSFDGKTFKAQVAITPQVIVELEGTVVNENKIAGAFLKAIKCTGPNERSTLNLQGTFTLERIRPLDGDPPEKPQEPNAEP